MLAIINDLSDLSDLSDFTECSDRFTPPPAKFEKDPTERLVKLAQDAKSDVDANQGRLFENDLLQFVADFIVLGVFIWLCFYVSRTMFPVREEVVDRCGDGVEPTMAEPSWTCAMAYLRHAHNVRAGLALNPRKVFEACNITCPGN
jgi:hypothetical protein